MAGEKTDLQFALLLKEAQVLKHIPDDFLRLPTTSTSPQQQQQLAGGLMLNGVPVSAFSKSPLSKAPINAKLPLLLIC